MSISKLSSRELARALGPIIDLPPRTTSFELHCAMDNMAIVKCTYIVELNDEQREKLKTLELTLGES